MPSCGRPRAKFDQNSASRRGLLAVRLADVKVLVICRPREGVAAEEIAAHAPAEMAALKEFQAAGSLLEAYSPGGPGAILIFSADRAAVEAAVSALPLLRARLIETEIIEPHPFAGSVPVPEAAPSPESAPSES